MGDSESALRKQELSLEKRKYALEILVELQGLIRARVAQERPNSLPKAMGLGIADKIVHSLILREFDKSDLC